MEIKNIPKSLLDKVQRAMRMEDADFEEYLEILKCEAQAYVKNLLYVDFDSLDETSKDIFIVFYMQYALYAKIEKDEISQDKLDFLNSYIEGYNSKTEKFEKSKISTLSGGVNFL